MLGVRGCPYVSFEAFSLDRSLYEQVSCDYFLVVADFLLRLLSPSCLTLRFERLVSMQSSETSSKAVGL
jgi:hypothetical protein